MVRAIRGFESHPLRHIIFPLFPHKPQITSRYGDVVPGKKSISAILFGFFIIFFLGFVLPQIQRLAPSMSSHPKAKQVVNPLKEPHVPIASRVERVMTIGSSAARGWMDTGWRDWRKGWFGGYLVYAFRSLSGSEPTRYVIDDRTIVGANSTQLATMYKGKYSSWLSTDHPQIVVLSWGLLNDALPHVPMPAFRSHIYHEIALALEHHAVVFLVTPPVSQASYTTYRVAQMKYVQNEMQVANDFHSKNVRVFDVFDQMKAYLLKHHQTYIPYMGNSWHPNHKGHVLAGTLLYQDIRAAYGEHPIVFLS